MRMHKHSLSHYLFKRLIPVYCLMCTLFVAITIWSYWFALDDTSTFYLFEDAHHFVVSPFEMHTDFKSVTTEVNSLSEFERNEVSNAQVINQPWLVSSETMDYYFLIFNENPLIEPVYVVHRFSKDETLNLLPIVILVALFLMICTAIYVIVVLQKVAKQTAAFTRNITQLSDQEAVLFSELEFAQKQILKAINEKEQAITREHHFASFLSHEIRTPLTGIGHHIAKFDQLDDLTEDTLNQIEALKKLQLNALEVSETILSLWHKSEIEHADQKQLLKALAKLKAEHEDKITLNVDVNKVKCVLNANEIHLFLNQIWQNYLRYGFGGLSITLNESSLIFSNQINQTPNCSHGSGVGLFIVKAIATKAGWHVKITTTNTRFIVCCEL